MILLLPFLFRYLLFYFSCLTVMARTPNIMLNKNSEGGHSSLVLILEKKLWTFHHWKLYELWVCHKWSLLCWGCSLYISFVERFLTYMDAEMLFVKCFLSIYWDHVIFIIHFVNVVYTLIHLLMLYHPYILGKNPIWSLCVILVMYCWIWLTTIFWKIFASIFSKATDLDDFVCVVFLSGFAIRIMLLLLLSHFSCVRLCVTP